MKPSMTFRNDWRWLNGEMAEFTFFNLTVDWFKGHYAYMSFTLLGLGFTAGAYSEAASDALIARVMGDPAGESRVVWFRGENHVPNLDPFDDPDAHLGGTWTRDGYVAHVGAQTATVTREPLNLPSNEDGS